MDSLDILESRVPLPESPGRRAFAWAETMAASLNLTLNESDQDLLARMVQAAMSEETNRCLLRVEQTLVNHIVG